MVLHECEAILKNIMHYGRYSAQFQRFNHLSGPPDDLFSSHVGG